MQPVSTTQETGLSPMTKFLTLKCTKSDNTGDCRRCLEHHLPCDRVNTFELAKTKEKNSMRKFLTEQGHEVERLHKRLLGHSSSFNQRLKNPFDSLSPPPSPFIIEKVKGDLITILSGRFPKMDPNIIAETVRTVLQNNELDPGSPATTVPLSPCPEKLECPDSQPL